MFRKIVINYSPHRFCQLFSECILYVKSDVSLFKSSNHSDSTNIVLKEITEEDIIKVIKKLKNKLKYCIYNYFTEPLYYLQSFV